MQAGLDLLDRDHHAIHGLLDRLAGSANGLITALNAGDGAAVERSAAERLAEMLAGTRTPLLRHLEDEEDIVVPLLTRHGDPFDLARAGG